MTSRRALMLAATLVGVLVLIVGVAVFRKANGPQDDAHLQLTATDEQLRTVARSQIYFGHQSVGHNIMDAVPGLYTSRGLEAPDILETRSAIDAAATGYLQHVRLGTNGDPLGKIREFDATIRGGVGNRVDLAIMKLCYVDVKVGTDVDAIFTEYRRTLSALERDYPEVVFLHATTPLTAERGPLGRLRAMVGRGDTLGPEHNVVRERLNSLMREEYGNSPRFFDIAAMQSTAADGTRISGSLDDEPYYAMADAYASDPGHLNGAGGAMVAEALVAVVAANLEGPRG